MSGLERPPDREVLLVHDTTKEPEAGEFAEKWVVFMTTTVTRREGKSVHGPDEEGACRRTSSDVVDAPLLSKV